MNQEDMQIIGTLALEKDTKRKGVFINTKSAIQYVVKSMMSDYKSDKLFTGYMNSFENDQKFDDEYRSDEERSAIICNLEKSESEIVCDREDCKLPI